MGKTTKIEWADATINFWWGCSKVSPACQFCYAESIARRFGVKFGHGQPRKPFLERAHKLALSLNAKAEKRGRRLRVFVNSMSDIFDPDVPAEWLAEVFNTIAQCQWLDFMLLTKRPELWKERMLSVIRSQLSGNGICIGNAFDIASDRPDKPIAQMVGRWVRNDPPQNVYIGTTVENQEKANERIPQLLKIPARLRFLSVEPLLGPVDLDLNKEEPDPEGCYADRRHGIHWVIAGGESGRNARPMLLAWARSLRDQCKTDGIPFFFKQWGVWVPLGPLSTSMYHVGKKAAGRLLDGVEHNEFPEVKP